MRKNNNLVNALEEKYRKERKLTYRQKLAIYESLYNEAVLLKALPPRNPLEGIDTDIKIAKILNSRLNKS